MALIRQCDICERNMVNKDHFFIINIKKVQTRDDKPLVKSIGDTALKCSLLKSIEICPDCAATFIDKSKHKKWYYDD